MLAMKIILVAALIGQAPCLSSLGSGSLRNLRKLNKIVVSAGFYLASQVFEKFICIACPSG